MWIKSYVMKAGTKVKFDIEKTKEHKKKYVEMFNHPDKIDFDVESEMDEVISNPGKEYTISEVMIDNNHESYVLCKELEYFLPSHLMIVVE